MSYTQRFTEDSGQTLYAVPSTITPSAWDSLKVACTEPFTGLYSVTVDETLGSEWWIYIGATVPSDWDDRIGAFSVVSSATVNVLPGYITKQKAQQNNELFVGVGSLTLQALTCFNTDGTVQSLSGLTLRFCVSVEDSTVATGETAVAQIENANITVSGASSNIATFRYTSAMVATPRRLIWSLRSDPSGNNVELQKGVLNVGVSADA